MLDDLKRVIRWRMKRRRLELGLRQEDVAGELEVTQKNYQLYEAGLGNFNPTLETLVKLCSVLGMSLETLVREPTAEELVQSKEAITDRVFKK